MASVLLLGDKYDKAWDGDVIALSTMPHYPVVPLAEALASTYDSDTHIGPYWLAGPDGGIVNPLPRLRREARDALKGKGLTVYVDCFFLDLDAPNHTASQEWYDETLAKIESLPPPLDCCAWYFTNGGARLVYESPRPLTVEQALMVQEWLALGVMSHGLEVDPSCLGDHKKGNGWTRLYRAPFVVRKGAKVRLPSDFSNMMPLDLPPDPVGLQTMLAEARKLAAARPAHTLPKQVREAMMATEPDFDPTQPYAGIEEATYSLPRHAIPDGAGRYRAVVRHCGFLCNQGYLPYEDFLRAVKKFNEAYCSPPKEDHEIEAIAETCYSRWMPPAPTSPQPPTIVPPLQQSDSIPEHLRSIDAMETDKPHRGMLVFPGESDVIVAETIIKHLEANTTQRLVYDLGKLWCFDPQHGLWCAITPSGLLRYICSFDGALMIAANGKPKPFAGDGKRLKTIQSMILSMCDTRALENDRGFFEDAPLGMACQNGFLRFNADRSEFVLEELRPEHRATFSVPCEWRGINYRHSTWDGFCRVFFANRDENDLAAQFMGASSFGMATQYQRACIIEGSGGNGKSTFMFAQTALLPPEAVCSLTPADLAHDYKGADLFGKRLNACAELPIKDIVSSDALKSVIPGDKITRRPIYKDPVTARPIAGHLFLTNELFRANDHTDGFHRKFLILHAPNKVKDFVREVPDFDKALTTPEVLPAVWAWQMRGLLRVVALGGYVLPDSVKQSLDEWRKESNTVATFLEEDCSPAAPTDWVRAAEAYDRYKTWCEANGHHYPLNATNFGTALARENIGRRRDRTARWVNLKWREPIKKDAKPEFLGEIVGVLN